MPFDSNKQRALFHAAKNDPKVRKKRGLRLGEIKKLIDEDKGGKLPNVSRATKQSLKRS